MIFPTEWEDVNGLVRPRKGFQYLITGNGITFTSVVVLLTPISDELYNWYFKRVVPCFKKPGLLMRNPQNTFGNQTHDDVMSFLTACIRLKNTEYPRMMFWYGMRHAFIYYTDTYFSWENLWRAIFIKHPHIIALMFAAAYPSMKWLSHPILWLTQKTVKPGTVSEIGSSAIQLQFIFQVAYIHLYEENETFKSWREHIDMRTAFKDYYDLSHPLQEML